MYLLAETEKDQLLEQLKQRETEVLKTKLKYIDNEIDMYKRKSVSKPYSFFVNRIPKTTGITGVYFIIHSKETSWYQESFWYNGEFKDDARIMYIGQGVVGRRRAIHKKVFNNSGQPLTFYDKDGSMSSQADSVVGRKMYNYDNDRQNWFFKYLECSKEWAPTLEEYYSWEYKPPFNDIKMLGLS